MPNPNAVVTTVTSVEPARDEPAAGGVMAESGAAVELADGRQVRLDPADSRSSGFAEILGELSERRLPVYLEVDPDTSAITRLLIPQVGRVADIRPIDDGVLGIELDASHARHVLRSGSPDFAALEGRLLAALERGEPIVLTENDAHEVIDVHDFTPAPEGPQPPLPFPRPKPIPLPGPELPWRFWRPFWELLLHIWRWPLWPWWWFFWWRCVTPARAQEIFDSMSATGCAPLTVPAPCIPFLYPDDGCWARAHEMCRLMIDMGLRPRKVWIQGYLHVNTRNHPSCGVWWGWHVAPTLCVRGSGFLRRERMVIDPSLFTAPVSQATWKGVQGDPNATLTPSDASDYLWGATDPTYSKTNDRLAYYRLQLRTRALQAGPPPYANCP